MPPEPAPGTAPDLAPEPADAPADAPAPTTRADAPLRIVAAGLLALAVAMGIGRFAFTPLLPVMLGEGGVDLAAGTWLATANYFGYLVGAIACAAQPVVWARRGWPPLDAARNVRIGLVATAVLTGGMALPLPALWPALRFAAGVASALVFVYTSGWCLGRLAALGRPRLAGAIYAGPGVGIFASGLLVGGATAAGGSAATGWALFAVLAGGRTLAVGSRVRGAPALAGAPAAVGGFTAEQGVFAFAYGLSGFGYIITATFLPVIARELLPPSPWLAWFWPLLGAGVVVGALLATRVSPRVDFRHALAGCYAMQAAGVVVGAWWPGVATFALGSVLVGLPFTAISFFGMQEARRLSPAAPAALMGLSTAVYGLGQIAGPPAAAWLIAHAPNPATGFGWALDAAAATLVAGAAGLVLLVRARPSRLSGSGSSPARTAR